MRRLICFVRVDSHKQGHYVPTLGAQLVRQNALYPSRPRVNLKSILVGNGLFSMLDQAFGYWATLCTTLPGIDEPVFNSTRCDIMAANLPRCMELARVCFSHPDPSICQVVGYACWDGVIKWYDSESYAGGRNRFDITAPCDIDDFCYANTALIQKYLNTPGVFDALGVPREHVKQFNVSSDAVALAFTLTNDFEISMTPQVLSLLANNVDVMIYQGKLDLACNTQGNIRYAESVPWKGQAEFVAKPFKRWRSGKKEVGEFKEVNIQTSEEHEKKTRFAFVTVDGSGHMVPQDQPEAALDLMVRWIEGKSFD